LSLASLVSTTSLLAVASFCIEIHSAAIRNLAFDFLPGRTPPHMTEFNDYEIVDLVSPNLLSGEESQICSPPSSYDSREESTGSVETSPPLFDLVSPESIAVGTDYEWSQEERNFDSSPPPPPPLPELTLEYAVPRPGNTSQYTLAA